MNSKTIKGWMISAALAEAVSGSLIFPWKKLVLRMYSPVPGITGTFIDIGPLLFRQIPLTTIYFTSY
jgi:hypothetical protein